MRKRDYGQLRFEYDHGGSKPRADNNVILSDVEMLESRNKKWEEKKVMPSTDLKLKATKKTGNTNHH